MSTTTTTPVDPTTTTTTTVPSAEPPEPPANPSEPTTTQPSEPTPTQPSEPTVNPSDPAPSDTTTVVDSVIDPPPPLPIDDTVVIIDDPTPAGPFIPPTTVTTTAAGLTYHYSTDAQAIIVEAYKDLDFLRLSLVGFTGNTVTQSWNGNNLTVTPLNADTYSGICLGLNIYTNPDLPNVFGTNFSTAFVNNTVEISSGTAYVSAPTLNMNIKKAGLYAVHWYVELLIPEGSVEVLVLANGSVKLSETTYGQSVSDNDWKTVSGFAVQSFPAGTTAGVKLAYKYVDPLGNQTMPTVSSTARNAKLMVYQVGRI